MMAVRKLGDTQHAALRGHAEFGLAALVSPSWRRPASRSACRIQLRMLCPVTLNSRGSSSGFRPAARCRSTIDSRNSRGYGLHVFGMWTPSSRESGKVSTTQGQLQDPESLDLLGESSCASPRRPVKAKRWPLNTLCPCVDTSALSVRFHRNFYKIASGDGSPRFRKRTRGGRLRPRPLSWQMELHDLVPVLKVKK